MLWEGNAFGRTHQQSQMYVCRFLFFSPGLGGMQERQAYRQGEKAGREGTREAEEAEVMGCRNRQAQGWGKERLTQGTPCTKCPKWQKGEGRRNKAHGYSMHGL